MKLEEIAGKRVKLSAATITVKDADGKTRGIVRNVRPFKSWSTRESFDHFKALGASGI